MTQQTDPWGFNETPVNANASGGQSGGGQTQPPGGQAGGTHYINKGTMQQPIGWLASRQNLLVKSNMSIEVILRQFLEFRKSAIVVDQKFSKIDFIPLSDNTLVDVCAILMTYECEEKNGLYVVPFFIADTAKLKPIKIHQQGIYPGMGGPQQQMDLHIPITHYYDRKYMDVICATIVQSRGKDVRGILPPVLITESTLSAGAIVHYVAQAEIAILAKIAFDCNRALDSRAASLVKDPVDGKESILTLAQLIKGNNNTYLTCSLNFAPGTEYTGAGEPIATDITATVMYNMNRGFNQYGQNADLYNSGVDSLTLGRASVALDFIQINDGRMLPYNGSVPGFQPLLVITSLDTSQTQQYSEIMSRIFGLTGVMLMVTDDNWRLRYDPSVTFTKGPGIGVLSKVFTPNRNIPMGETTIVSDYEATAFNQNAGTTSLSTFLSLYCVSQPKSPNDQQTNTVPLVAIDLPFGSSSPLDELLFLMHPGSNEFEKFVDTIDVALSVRNPETGGLVSTFRSNLMDHSTGQCHPLFLSNASVPSPANSCGAPYENIRINAISPKEDGSYVDLRTVNILDFINLGDTASLQAYIQYTQVGYTSANPNLQAVQEMQKVYKQLFNNVKFLGLGRRRYINPVFLNALTKTYKDIGLAVKPEGVQMPNYAMYTAVQAPVIPYIQGGLFVNTGPSQVNSSFWQGMTNAFTGGPI